MARGDYRGCDVCDGKAFYDANLNYEDADNEYVKMRGAQPYRVAGELQYPDNPELNAKYGKSLDYVGDWAVLCDECAKTHRTAILSAFDGVLPQGHKAVPFKKLANLAQWIAPPPVEVDGKTMVFQNPMAAEVLRRLSAEIRELLEYRAEGIAGVPQRVAGAEQQSNGGANG